MTTKYKHSKDVPTSALVARLRELSDAVTKRESQEHEFTMRVPAEADRDADLVLSEAANRLEQKQGFVSNEPFAWAYVSEGPDGKQLIDIGLNRSGFLKEHPNNYIGNPIEEIPLFAGQKPSGT
jgi:hypothetical protein